MTEDYNVYSIILAKARTLSLENSHNSQIQIDQFDKFSLVSLKFQQNINLFSPFYRIFVKYIY